MMSIVNESRPTKVRKLATDAIDPRAADIEAAMNMKTGVTPQSIATFASTLQLKGMIRLVAYDGTCFYVQEDVFTRSMDVQLLKTPNMMYNKTLKFGNSSSKALEYFVYWLYHGEVHFAMLDKDHEWMDNEPYYPAAYLWILGERYGITKLQNLAMERLFVCKAYSEFTPSLIEDVFNYTAMGSQLQRFLAREALLTWRAIDLAGKEDLLELGLEEIRDQLKNEVTDSKRFMISEEM